MKTYEAIYETQSIISGILEGAGFKDGLQLSETELKAELVPVFWYINIKSKAGSEKETYITYSILETPPYQYADGNVEVRRPSVDVEVFTRKRFIKDTIRSLEEAFLANQWTFELTDVSHDPGIQMYQHTFNCQALLSDDE